MLRYIQVGQDDERGVQRLLGGKPGTPTGKEIPGLSGSVMVWEEDGRKVYVSFSPVNGKVTAYKEEGF